MQQCKNSPGSSDNNTLAGQEPFGTSQPHLHVHLNRQLDSTFTIAMYFMYNSKLLLTINETKTTNANSVGDTIRSSTFH